MVRRRDCAGRALMLCGIVGFGTVALPIAVVLFAAAGTAIGRDEPTLRIAVPLTLSGPAGNIGTEVLDGIRMAIEDAGAQAARIELAVFDDSGDVETARETARRIAASDALMVMGPSLSVVATQVEQIYAEAGLAVLSPNIASEEATSIFRLNMGLRHVGESLADYLHYALAGRRAALIYSDDGLGRPIARGFKLGAERLGVIASYHPVVGADQIIAAARRIADDPGRPAVIFGLLETQAVPAVMLLKRAGVSGPFLAIQSFAYSDYARLFAAEPEERANPGFFTGGLYAASLLLFDSGNAALLAFEQRYRARRGHEPSHRVILGYDAMRLLLNILTSALQGVPPDLSARRRAVLEAIAALNDPARARIGLSGPIWFEPGRGRPLAMRMARFNKTLLESAPVQLVPVENPDPAEVTSGAVVPVMGGKFARFQQVVFTGIYLNEISRLDLPQSSFTADFYLWLRAAGNTARPANADPADIVFPDLLRGQFDKARPSERRDLPDGSAYQLWRVQGEFRTDFDLRRFPFDRQTVVLRLSNARAASDRIVYALDRRALIESRQAAAGGTAMIQGGGDDSPSPWPVGPDAFEKLTQWQALDVGERRDVLVTPSALGDPLLVGSERVRELSGFRFDVELRRRAATTMVKTLLPVGLLTLMMFASLWYPRTLVRDKVAVALASALSGAVLLAAINSQLGNVGYTMAVEYVFYLFFSLALLCTISVFVAERLRLAGNYRAAARTEFGTRLTFILILAVTAIIGWSVAFA